MSTATRQRIDPRMADRRDGVRRARRRRTVGWLAVPVVVLLLVASAVALGRSPVLDVDRVEVVGAHRTPARLVAETAGIDRGDQMVDLDPEGAASDVADLPWIDDVRVIRDWPSAVRIEVSEREAVAVVEAASGGLLLVDATGRLLEATREQASRVMLEGVPAGEQPGGQLEAPPEVLEVAAAIGPDLEEAVASVVWHEGEARLRLRPEGMARLGGVEDLEAKLAAVLAVWGQVDDRCIETIDVRVPTAPAVTRSAGCTAAADAAQ